MGVDVVGNLLGLADGCAVGVAVGCAVGVDVVGNLLRLVGDEVGFKVGVCPATCVVHGPYAIVTLISAPVVLSIITLDKIVSFKLVSAIILVVTFCMV